MQPASRDIATENKIAVSPRVCLADLFTVRVKHGCDGDAVSQMIETGQYIWVFNLARPGGSVRKLRFLLDEVTNPQSVRGLDLDAVLNRILPAARASFPPGEICLRFLISRPTWMRLRHELKLGLGNAPRKPLVEYLRSRWIGDGK